MKRAAETASAVTRSPAPPALQIVVRVHPVVGMESVPRIPRVVKRAPPIAGRVAQSTAARSAMDLAATVVIVKPVSATRMPSVVMPSGMISACPSAPRTAEVVETSSVGMVHASRVKPAMGVLRIAESAPAFAETGLARSRKIAIPARGIAECASWTAGTAYVTPERIVSIAHRTAGMQHRLLRLRRTRL